MELATQQQLAQAAAFSAAMGTMCTSNRTRNNSSLLAAVPAALGPLGCCPIQQHLLLLQACTCPWLYRSSTPLLLRLGSRLLLPAVLADLCLVHRCCIRGASSWPHLLLLLLLLLLVPWTWGLWGLQGSSLA
jgi:hypothetical protein